MAGFLRLEDAQGEITRRLTDFGQQLFRVGGPVDPQRDQEDVVQRLTRGGLQLIEAAQPFAPPQIQTLTQAPQALRTLQQGAQTVQSFTQPQPQAQQPALAQGPAAERGGDLRAYARQSAIRAGIDPDIFERQIQQESGFQTRAQSPAGAQGIAQIVPRFHPGVDPNDPYASLDYASNLMQSHLQKYGGDYSKALAAYNAGPGAVERYGGIPPFEETQRYVSTILGEARRRVEPFVQGAQAVGRAISQPHTEEPASATDVIGDKWKTSFDWGARYTGNYRTGTPHRGIDLVPQKGGIGTSVEAFQPGTVTLMQRDRGAGGLMVYVRDDQGLTHAYMHLQGTAPGLKVGQRVERGQQIATMGESGTEGSPHLHYEVRRNAATGDPLDQLIDPRPYLTGGARPTGPLTMGQMQPGEDKTLTRPVEDLGTGVQELTRQGLDIIQSARRNLITPEMQGMVQRAQPGGVPMTPERAREVRGELEQAPGVQGAMGLIEAFRTSPAANVLGTAARTVLTPQGPLEALGVTPQQARGMILGPAAISDEDLLATARTDEIESARQNFRTLWGREPSQAQTLEMIRGLRTGTAYAGERGQPPVGRGPSGEITMGAGTTGISQTPTFLRESLRRMYPGAINKAAVKEAVQNSVDASRGIPGATTYVDVSNKNKTVSIIDQGKGMSPQTMEAVFVRLGGSDKPAGASGGMGTAIKAVMANGEETWVRSVGRDPTTGQLTDSVMHGSSDDFLGGTMHRYYARYGEMPQSELAGAPPEIANWEAQHPSVSPYGPSVDPTGTVLWTRPMADASWSPYTLLSWVNNFNHLNRVADQRVQFTVDGEVLDPGKRYNQYDETRPPTGYNVSQDDLPTDLIQTIKTPGAEIDLYGSKSVSESGSATVHLLNQGQYQADLHVYLDGNAKLPSTLSANIRPTVGAKDVGYPWTADRNALVDVDAQGLRDFVKNDLAVAAVQKEHQRISDSIDIAPIIKRSGGQRLVDDAEVGRFSGGADALQKVTQSPAYARLSRAAESLHNALSAELAGREVMGVTVGDSRLIGLGISDKWHGLNLPPSFTPWANTGDATKGILINPWTIWHEIGTHFGSAPRSEQLERFSEMLMGTMTHEIAHNTSIRGHEEGFAGILTRLPTYLGTRMRNAVITELRRDLTPVWDTLANDLSDDAATFRFESSGGPSIARFGEESAIPGGARPDVLAGDVAGGGAGGPPGGGAPDYPGGGPAGYPPGDASQLRPRGEAQAAFAAGLGGAVAGGAGLLGAAQQGFLSPATERLEEARAGLGRFGEDVLSGLGTQMLERGEQERRAANQIVGTELSTPAAQALVDRAKQAGWQPDPGEEQIVRNTAANLLSPLNVGLTAVTAGGATIPQLALRGGASLGGAAVLGGGAEIAARRLGAPEPVQQAAGLAGTLVGGVGAPWAATRAARSPAVQRFLAEEEGALTLPFGRRPGTRVPLTSEQIAELGARGDATSPAERDLYQQTVNALLKGQPAPAGANVSTEAVTIRGAAKKSLNGQTVELPVMTLEDGTQLPLRSPKAGIMGTPENAAYNQLVRELGGNRAFPFGRWKDPRGVYRTFDSPQELAVWNDLERQKQTGQIQDWWTYQDAPPDAPVRDLRYINTQPDKYGVQTYKPDIVVQFPDGSYQVREVKALKVLVASEDIGGALQAKEGTLGWHVLKKALGIIPQLAQKGASYQIIGEDEAARIVNALGTGKSQGARLASLPGVDWRDVPELMRRGVQGAPEPGAETIAGLGLRIANEINQTSQAALEAARGGATLQALTRLTRDRLLPTARIAGREHGPTREWAAQLMARAPFSARGQLTLAELAERWPEAGEVLTRAGTRGVRVGPLSMQWVSGAEGGAGIPRLMAQLDGDPAGIQAAAAEIGRLQADTTASLVVPDDMGTSGLRRIDVRLADQQIQAALHELVEAAPESGLRVLPGYNQDGTLAYLHVASDSLEPAALAAATHGLAERLEQIGVALSHAPSHGRATIRTYAQGAESAAELAEQQRILGELPPGRPFEPVPGGPPPWRRDVPTRTAVGPEGRLVEAPAAGEPAPATGFTAPGGAPLGREPGIAAGRFAAQLGGAAVGGATGYATTPEEAGLPERILRTGLGATTGLIGTNTALGIPGALAVGRGVSQTRQAARAVAATQSNLPGMAAAPPKAAERVLAYLVNNALSNTASFFTNASGLLENARRPIVTVATAGVELATGNIPGARREMAAAGADLAAMGAALGDGLAAMAQTFATGVRPSRVITGDIQREAFEGPLGVVMTPFLRGMAAVDEFNATLSNAGGQGGEIARLAVANPNLSVPDVMARFQPQIMAEGVKSTEEALYISGGSGIGRWWSSRTQELIRAGGGRQLAGFGMNMLVPFAKIPDVLLTRGLLRLPVLNEVRAGIQATRAARAGRPTEAKRIIAEAALTEMINVAVAYQVVQGNITGNGPRDPMRKRAKMAARDANGNAIWAPNSIRVGDRWISYSSWGPLAVQLGGIANGIEIAQDESRELTPEYTAAAFLAVGETVADAWYLQSMARIFSGIRNGQWAETTGETMVDYASRIVPEGALANQIRNASDPNIREPQNLLQRLQNRLPVAAGGVPERIDLATGRAFQRPTDWAAFFVRGTAPGDPDRVNAVLAEHNLPSPQLPDTLSMGPQRFPLEQSEKEAYARALGPELTKRVLNFADSPAFRKQDPLRQQEQLQRQIGLARQIAEARVWQTIPAADRRRRAAEYQAFLQRQGLPQGFDQGTAEEFEEGVRTNLASGLGAAEQRARQLVGAGGP